MFRASYKQMARFADGLATCIASGIDMSKSVKQARRAFANTMLESAFAVVQERVDEGMSLAEAMSDVGKRLPPFFVAVLWAGEQTGRLAESARYLEEHCNALVGPANTARNTWLVPLCVIAGGSVLRLLAHLYWGTAESAFTFLWQSLLDYLYLAGFVVLLLAPPLRPLWGKIRLRLPFVGNLERELGSNRFFHILGLLYCAAGHRVEKMIQVSAATVSNVAMRRDLLTAAARIQSGATIGEAFEAPAELTHEQKDAIIAGDMAGKLDEVFNRLSRLAGESLQTKLNAVQHIFFRITMALVVYSVIRTVWGLMLMRMFVA